MFLQNFRENFGHLTVVSIYQINHCQINRLNCYQKYLPHRHKIVFRDFLFAIFLTTADAIILSEPQLNNDSCKVWFREESISIVQAKMLTWMFLIIILALFRYGRKKIFRLQYTIQCIAQRLRNIKKVNSLICAKKWLLITIYAIE